MKLLSDLFKYKENAVPCFGVKIHRKRPLFEGARLTSPTSKDA